MYKKDDKVTLSATVTLNIGDYNSIKPSASITRVLGQNPEHDLEEMETALHKSLAKSLRVGVGFTKDMFECLNLGGLDAIQQYSNEHTNDTTQKSEESGAKPKRKKVRRKKSD
jgi:hypothetical protein